MHLLGFLIPISSPDVLLSVFEYQVPFAEIFVAIDQQ